MPASKSRNSSRLSRSSAKVAAFIGRMKFKKGSAARLGPFLFGWVPYTRESRYFSYVVLCCGGLRVRPRIVWIAALAAILLLSAAGWLLSRGSASTSILNEVAGAYSPFGPPCDLPADERIFVRPEGLSDTTGQINPSELNFYRAEKFVVPFAQGYNSEIGSNGTTWYLAFSRAADDKILVSAFTQIPPRAFDDMIDNMSLSYEHQDHVRVFYYRNTLFDHKPDIEEVVSGKTEEYGSYALLFPCKIVS